MKKENSVIEQSYLYWLWKQLGADGRIVAKDAAGFSINFHNASYMAWEKAEPQIATLPQERLQALASLACRRDTRAYGESRDGSRCFRPISTDAFKVYNRFLDIADKAAPQVALALRTVVLGRVASMRCSTDRHDVVRLKIARRLLKTPGVEGSMKKLAQGIERKIEVKVEQTARHAVNKGSARAYRPAGGYLASSQENVPS